MEIDTSAYRWFDARNIPIRLISLAYHIAEEESRTDFTVASLTESHLRMAELLYSMSSDGENEEVAVISGKVQDAWCWKCRRAYTVKLISKSRMANSTWAVANKGSLVYVERDSGPDPFCLDEECSGAVGFTRLWEHGLG